MKRQSALLVSAALLGCLCLLSGCSLFVSTPRMARIQIKGPANHTNEVVFALDDSQDKGINLTDRYTMELDFQWLWYEREDLNFLKRDENKDDSIPLTPWFICKYRF